MKITIKNLLFSVVIICLSSSFVSGPVMNDPITKEGISTAITFGGAYLYFAGKYGGEIKKKDLAGQKELKVEGCAKGSKIISYTLEINKRGTKSAFSGRSNVLSDEMVTKLQGLEPGDTFEFKEVKATMPNTKDVVDVHGQKFVVA
ncbi:MAG TPA: hypothetical protein VFG10_07725 [Saprospiraceae bacterium]|nr:hypothetical protein [Saprospiraceae bacterium]